MKRIILACFVVIALVVNVHAETLTNEADVNNLIKKSIDLFTDKKFNESMELLKPYYPASPIALDNAANQAKSQWGLIEDNYGKKIGIEFIDSIKVGKSLIKYVYIVKFEKYILKFDVITYRNDSGWVIVDFNFNDKVKELF